MSKLFVFGFLVWPLFVILAIVNATVREMVYKPYVGELRAHQISSLVFIVVIFAVTYFFLRLTAIPSNQKEYILLGACWLCLTVAFEFLFGHYVVGDSWERLLSGYNIFAGQLWILIPLTMLLAPSLMKKML